MVIRTSTIATERKDNEPSSLHHHCIITVVASDGKEQAGIACMYYGDIDPVVPSSALYAGNHSTVEQSVEQSVSERGVTWKPARRSMRAISKGEMKRRQS